MTVLLRQQGRCCFKIHASHQGLPFLALQAHTVCENRQFFCFEISPKPFMACLRVRLWIIAVSRSKAWPGICVTDGVLGFTAFLLCWA